MGGPFLYTFILPTMEYDFWDQNKLTNPTTPEGKLAGYLTSTLICMDAIAWKLINEEMIPYDDTRNLYEDKDGEPQQIFTWYATRLGDYELDQLEKAGIPLIRSEYGDWIGRTDFGSAIELYCLPQWLDAIFSKGNTENPVQ